MFNNCAGCIFKTATCGTRGPQDSPFVIVGESPGKNEIEKGQPFVGESGKMLDTFLAQAFKSLGKEPIEPYYTNAVSCFPQGKDQAKMEKACKACHFRLMEDVLRHPRKVVLALGGPSIQSLTGTYDIKITQIRGAVFNAEPFRKIAQEGIVATVHPAFLMRGSGSLPKFKKDLATAVKLLCDVPLPQFIMSSHTVLTSEEHINAIHAQWASSPEAEGLKVGSDIETSGFSSIDDDILCVGLGRHDQPKQTYVIPEELVPTPATKNLLENRRFRYTWHNGKFDIRFLRDLGKKPGSNYEPILAEVHEDTMMMSYALDENRGIHDLEQVSFDACGAPNWKAMLDQYRSSKHASYREIPVPVLHKYLGLDIGATTQSADVLRPQVDADPHLSKLYKHLIRWSNFLVAVEQEGMLVDKEQTKKMYVRFMQEIHDRKAAINKVAVGQMGKEINPNSPAQVAELMYDKLKLPTWKGSRSTDADTLDMLPQHSFVKKLKDYRRSAKIYSTYVKNLYNFDPLDKKNGGSIEGTRGENVHSDGCVHCTYLLHGSVTGRLASRDINMQNIPREADIRSQFIAKPGRRLVEFDYNQAELRCLAELSRCDDLCAIYLDALHPGLHHEMSVFLFGPNYTDEDKMRTKAVNFGIVYGRTPQSLAEEFKVDLSEANRWIVGWFKRFPGAAKFINSCREAPLKGRTLITPFGRKRRFGVVSWENKNRVQNEASNFPHQSIASDCNLESAERVYSSFARDYDARPCNLVHDSNIWSLPDNDGIIKAFGLRVIAVMEQTPHDYGLTYIPFVADGKVGYRWGHLEKVKKSYWESEAMAA